MTNADCFVIIHTYSTEIAQQNNSKSILTSCFWILVACESW